MRGSAVFRVTSRDLYLSLYFSDKNGCALTVGHRRGSFNQ
jgi:hypothetical protein